MYFDSWFEARDIFRLRKSADLKLCSSKADSSWNIICDARYTSRAVYTSLKGSVIISSSESTPQANDATKSIREFRGIKFLHVTFVWRKYLRTLHTRWSLIPERLEHMWQCLWIFAHPSATSIWFGGQCHFQMMKLYFEWIWVINMNITCMFHLRHFEFPLWNAVRFLIFQVYPQSKAGHINQEGKLSGLRFSTHKSATSYIKLMHINTQKYVRLTCITKLVQKWS